VVLKENEKKALKELKRALSEKFEILDFRLFGSKARGTSASSKHTGILSFFNRRFIKTGVFPEEIGQSINNAFELRQRGDYRRVY
jgi:predicted nucleotidyltransferase